MSESFEKLRNRILSDARINAEGIVKEAEEKSEQILENARAEAAKEAATILTRARSDAGALRRSILSAKVRANRLRLLEEKNRIIRSVISSVEDALSTKTKSGSFPDSLKRMVVEAVAAVASDKPVVRIGFYGVSEREMDSVGSALPRGAKIVVEGSPIDQLGGVIASDPEGRVVFNNSFRARMDRLDTQILAVVSSTIFEQ